jgi:protein-L-isoaspartate(D-aspartate) O-methyltransferase
LGRFEIERQEMVDLIKRRGVSDERVLKAMMKVERHLFVPQALANSSYDDTALPIGFSQTISQPYTVAFMTECVDVCDGAKVLEIGTGSGYQAAILAEMGARVFTIERVFGLLEQARRILDELGYNVASKVGDGSVGWSEFAPYDGIIVTAAAPSVPQSLFKQVREGGKIVIPVGNMDVQDLNIVTKLDGKPHIEEQYGFKFVPLLGKEGWSK